MLSTTFGPWSWAAALLSAGILPCLWTARRASGIEALASAAYAGALAALAWLCLGGRALGAVSPLVEALAGTLLLSGVGLLLIAAGGLPFVSDVSDKLRFLEQTIPGVWAVAAAAALSAGASRDAAKAVGLAAVLSAMVPALRLAVPPIFCDNTDGDRRARGRQRLGEVLARRVSEAASRLPRHGRLHRLVLPR